MGRDSVVPTPPQDRKQLSSEDVGSRETLVVHVRQSVIIKKGAGTTKPLCCSPREERGRCARLRAGRDCKRLGLENRIVRARADTGGTVSCDAFYFYYTRRARTRATRAARRVRERVGVGAGGMNEVTESAVPTCSE